MIGFHHSRGWIVAVAALGGALSACGGAQQDAGTSGTSTPSVTFVGLQDGAELTAPAQVCVEVTGLTIEPSGDVKPDSGHHHLIVDPSADELAKYTAGTTDAIAKDDTHLHLGDGTNCFTIETLAPGEHELLTVVADGAHVPLNPPVVASVTVMAK